jgi:hypothetical protein
VGNPAGQVDFEFVGITPAPVLAWFERFYDWVFGGVKVLGGMFILGGIAAADMPARKTNSQVYPGVAGLDAIFADTSRGVLILRLLQVTTDNSHAEIVPLWRS